MSVKELSEDLVIYIVLRIIKANMSVKELSEDHVIYIIWRIIRSI